MTGDQPTADTLPPPVTGWFHVRKDALHGRSASEVDPPFESFDVVLRRDYEAREALLLSALRECHGALQAAIGHADHMGLTDATYWVRDVRAALARLRQDTSADLSAENTVAMIGEADTFAARLLVMLAYYQNSDDSAVAQAFWDRGPQDTSAVGTELRDALREIAQYRAYGGVHDAYREVKRIARAALAADADTPKAADS